MADQPSGETPGGEQPPTQEVQLILPPALLAGSYANVARVSHTEYEFTIDFASVDFPQAVGVVVARIQASHAFAEKLWRVLGEELDKYTEKALQEVLPDVTDDPGEDHGTGGGSV